MGLNQSNSLVNLFKNIEQSLKIYSADELADELNNTFSTLLSKENKNKYIHTVIGMVADECSVSRKALLESNLRGQYQQARMLCYCLLRHELGIDTDYIANKIFKKSKSAISFGLNYQKKLDGNIKEHKIFGERYLKLKCQLINKIKNKENDGNN